MLFSLGQVVMTYGAIDALEEAEQNSHALLMRHRKGDWGDVSDEDKKANDEAVENGSRILSIYTLWNKVKVWVITEADRSSTTILLPEEY